MIEKPWAGDVGPSHDKGHINQPDRQPGEHILREKQRKKAIREEMLRGDAERQDAEEGHHHTDCEDVLRNCVRSGHMHDTGHKERQRDYQEALQAHWDRFHRHDGRAGKRQEGIATEVMPHLAPDILIEDNK